MQTMSTETQRDEIEPVSEPRAKKKPAKKPKPITGDQQSLLQYLKSNGPIGILKLSKRSGFGWSRTVGLMESLESREPPLAHCNSEGICFAGRELPRTELGAGAK